MHYHRLYRTGTTTKGPYIVKPRKDVNGYIHYGLVALHRIAYRYKYGDNLPPCWSCGKELSWDDGKKMHIDHIDENIENNHIDNLRASCFLCNTHRSSHKQGILLTARGRTMNVASWVREPDVVISYGGLLARLKRGQNAEEAIFGKRKTRRD